MHACTQPQSRGQGATRLGVYARRREMSGVADSRWFVSRTFCFVDRVCWDDTRPTWDTIVEMCWSARIDMSGLRQMERKRSSKSRCVDLRLSRSRSSSGSDRLAAYHCHVEYTTNTHDKCRLLFRQVRSCSMLSRLFSRLVDIS
jgi:hypothetical protein